jgi:RimJ/RimL family protein N-acetyltransferase
VDLISTRLRLRPFQEDDVAEFARFASARTVIDDGFTRRGYAEIVARADPGNVASVRAPARLGFVAMGADAYRLTRGQWKPPTA